MAQINAKMVQIAAEVGDHYYGKRTRETREEIRWGASGSKSLDKASGGFYDFEMGAGGGVSWVIQQQEGPNVRVSEVLESVFGLPREEHASVQPFEFTTAIYEYFDQYGIRQYQVKRRERSDGSKRFQQWREVDGELRSYPGVMKDVTPLPYNLPAIVANPRDTIIVVEGEKCADAVAKLGLLSTTNHGGAGNWKPDLNHWFTDRTIVIIPDNDEAGQNHANKVANELYPVARKVGILSLPDLGPKGDIVDWIKAGGTRDDLLALIKLLQPIRGTVVVSDQTPPDTFQLLSLSELRNMPPAEWLVEGYLPRHGLAALYGPPGAGKSFLALDMALCVAYGKPFNGRVVAHGPVIYIAGEGVGGMGKRIKAWEAFNGVHNGAPFYLLPAAVKFREAADIVKLIDTAASMQQSPVMIVVDTVARALLGGDENSSTDMGLFVDACDAIRKRFNCALLAVHHSGKDVTRGLRGSNALLGGIDTSILMNPLEGDDGQRISEIKIEKQKDAEPVADHKFRFESIGLISDSSVVLVPHEEEERDGLSPTQRDALSSLTKAIARAGQDHILHSAWAQQHGQDFPDTPKSSRGSARQRLQARGLVEIADGKVWIGQKKAATQGI